MTMEMDSNNGWQWTMMEMDNNNGWRQRSTAMEMAMDKRMSTMMDGDKWQGRTIDEQTTRQG